MKNFINNVKSKLKFIKSHILDNYYLISILFLCIIILYFSFFIYTYAKINRDDNFLDFNDKVKSEYKNLLNNGFITPDRIPSSIHGCSYATVEFGFGILAEYGIRDNITECKAIRKFAGIEDPISHKIIKKFVKSK